jgi:hypothetical protein
MIDDQNGFTVPLSEKIGAEQRSGQDARAPGFAQVYNFHPDRYTH